MNVRVTPQSQPERLRERVADARIAHGDEVRADVDNVRVAVGVEASFGALWRSPRRKQADIYFCNVGPIRIRQRLSEGDHAPLPVAVDIQGLNVEGVGYYDLRNALIRSNGRIEIVVDEETTVHAAEVFAPL